VLLVREQVCIIGETTFFAGEKARSFGEGVRFSCEKIEYVEFENPDMELNSERDFFPAVFKCWLFPN